ncbi:putative T7SS-secreted protein [Streptomyces botrytidirepellens]|uniref:RHS repeat protein n=1 Tax=Streptomyces botrytidirepellens TaxID=2486417 RepID=A0A3M8WNH0_9ACTN|nr:RHS repeat-associated core domain-containing protein [Streptomyces botrytidirepellens]RNG30509.1 RHS repeat protein [Streptomyces botrytidirepellens]
MGLGDFIPDPVEDFVEDRVEDVGDGIESAGSWTADRLDDAGWEGGADWVRDKSATAADALGADVDEWQLDQTDDPKKLVHGDPNKLRSTAEHLTDFAKAFNNVGRGLKGVDPDQMMKGVFANAFYSRVSVEPKKWYKAADACEKAGGALSRFAGTVEWAQQQAQLAIDKYKAAKKASDDARSAHNSKVDAYNAAAMTYNLLPADERDPSTLPDKPGEFHDPGAEGIKAAEDILKEARRQRNEAHDAAKKSVETARDEAPAKPSYSEQVSDGFEGLKLDASHLAGGVIKGTAGVVNFARQVNPIDPYNLTHPAEYVTNLNSTAAGLVQMANNPGGALKGMYDSFTKDPAEGIGRLLPELIGTKGLGAAKGAATAAKTATTASKVESGLAHLAKDGHAPHSIPNGAKTPGPTDPVDLATGRMYLPQTDVSLPGVLPLAFTRQGMSGYRAGRWFGPSWACTADERLEIGPAGVVFVQQDGLLLDYPHPAPGVPTLPKAGPRWPLERNAEGDFTVTEPDTGRVRYFTGPADGGDGDAPIAEISDRNGHRLTFEYGADGAPAAIVHDGGYHLKLTTRDGRITALHLAGGAPDGSDQELVRYGYTEGDLTEVANSSGRPTRFAYDDERRIIAWTDTNGHAYDYVYDNRDRVIAEGGTEGHFAARIHYGAPDPHTGHRVTTVTSAEGNTSRYVVNERSQIVAVTDASGHTVRTEQDRFGRVLSRTDPLGRTVRYAYDAEGRCTRVTDAAGFVSTSTYNDLGLPLEIAEADGAIWRHEYDERGNPTALTDPTGHTTHHTYDERGHLSAITNPLGDTTRVRCDAAGLPVEITDPLGAVTVYHRDAFGRPTAVVDPLGATTRLEWTTEGKLARHTAPDGAEQRWTYDGEGNCTAHVDANGGVTSFEYAHFDQLVAQTGPDGARYEFTHDKELRLTRVTNPQGLTWSYTYDPAGRPLSESDFDGRTLEYAYDASGKLVSRTNPLGQTVSFERDATGRIVRKDAAGQVTTYSYDPVGRLATAFGPDGEAVFRRDAAGRLTSELVGGRTLTHTYDALGRRTGRTTPSGATSTFTYDAAGNRTALTTCGHTLAFDRDALGRETGRHVGDGLTIAQVWDPAGRLAEQTVTGPSARPLQHRAYTYRADGHLVGLDDRLGGSRHFDVDAAGRVTAVHAENWTETYAYDEAGNQTHASWPDQLPGADATGPRAYRGTRIARAGRVRYEHDAAGRITLRQKNRLSKKPDTWRYTWDAEDRLTSVTTPDGTVWRYLYDPLGRRLAKLRLGDDGVTAVERVDFTWDGSTLVEQTTTAPGLPDPVTLTWDHEGLRPVAQTERITDATTQAEIDQRFFGIVTDLVGTPSELVDESGEIAWRTRATLWGTTTWSRHSTAYTPLRFPGQYYDPETGLHYNHHRYYDPETARYATPDPLGLEAAPNPAAYVTNPHAAIDPLGLCPKLPHEQPPQGTFGPSPGPFGRPDGEVVLSGHGGISAQHGVLTTVPEGTHVALYSRHGETISDALGNKIETGNPAPVRVYGPGEHLPDYTLFPPKGLNIEGTPVTVDKATPLSHLLQPNMGRVHWAACRSLMD